MDFKNIKKFIDLAKEEGVAELKYETKEVKISVNFLGNASVKVTPSVTTTTPVENKLDIRPVGEPINDGLHDITSPFVGTFYTSPSPGKPTYVKVGDHVSKGQTLCILEAMKIMNEIECDVSGEIVEICTDNESVVEFGQTLFKVRV